MFKRLYYRVLLSLIPRKMIRLPTEEELEQVPKEQLFDLWKVVSAAWTKKNHDLNIKRMRLQSGDKKTDDLLVAFFYVLIRDVLPLGRVESIVLSLSNWNSPNAHGGAEVTNGWLLEYCEDVVDRLTNDSFTTEKID